MTTARTRTTNAGRHRGARPPRRRSRGSAATRVDALAVVVAAAVLSLAPAGELPAQTAADFAPVAAEIRETMSERGIPSVAVAAARDGEVVWEEAFGWADRERRVPATPHTPYSLASISKPMTATAILKLVEEGRLELSDPVNRHLAVRARLVGRAGDAAGATVRRVLAHTAGLPLHYQFFYDGEPGPPSRDETIRRYGNVVFPPGERFRYSNLGYGVLDHLVSRVSARPYGEYMRAEIFLPLGLTRTAIGVPGRIRGEAAVRYDPDTGEPIARYDFDHPGASAAWSSAHDLVRFGLFHLGHDPEEGAAVLTGETRREMQRPATPEDGDSAYGLGWFVDEEFGFRKVWHTGSMPGVSTMLALFPEEDAAIVVLMNTLARDLRVAFQQRIADVLIPAYADARRADREERRDATSSGAAGAEEDTGRRGLDELRGTWHGTLHTWREELPVRMTVRDGGDVHVQVDDQLETVLDGAELEDGVLSGRLWGRLPTPDAMRHPRHRLSLELLVRDGAMRGELTASTTASPTHYALSSYLELQRAP